MEHKIKWNTKENFHLPLLQSTCRIHSLTVWKLHISQWLMLCKRLCIYLKSGWSKHLFVSHNYKNSVSTFKWSCQKQRKEYAKISINYIKSGYAATVFCHCSSTVQFWWDTLFFLNSSYSIKQHCIYNSTVFFFLGLPFVLFLFYIYCYTNTMNFTIIDVLISYKSK